MPEVCTGVDAELREFDGRPTTCTYSYYPGSGSRFVGPVLLLP